MRWTDNVTRMGRKEMLAKFCCGSLRGRDYLEDVGVDGRKLLK
jgi:hypothetical protein